MLTESEDDNCNEEEGSASEEESNGSDSDSSTGDSNKCPICLLRFKGQAIGFPEVCGHPFCLDCILEWSKVCPIRPSIPYRLLKNTFYIRMSRHVQMIEGHLKRFWFVLIWRVRLSEVYLLQITSKKKKKKLPSK